MLSSAHAAACTWGDGDVASREAQAREPSQHRALEPLRRCVPDGNADRERGSEVGARQLHRSGADGAVGRACSAAFERRPPGDRSWNAEMQIAEITVEHFRGWQGPVTWQPGETAVLVGPNSGGK